MSQSADAGNAPSDRTRVRRIAARGRYDHESIRSILAEGLVCHVGFVHDEAPVVIPMAYGVDDEYLYLHGSLASRALRTLAEGAQLSATVTLLDGMVLARSAFHHSMNYRSVVVFGQAEEVVDLEERNRALRVITEHLVPGRWEEARQPTKKELQKTRVLRLPWRESSAKIRTGPPKDDAEDYELDVWAGVIPLELRAGTPQADEQLRPGIPLANSATDYRRPRTEDTSS